MYKKAENLEDTKHACFRRVNCLKNQIAPFKKMSLH